VDTQHGVPDHRALLSEHSRHSQGWAGPGSTAVLGPPPPPQVIFGVGPRMKETWYLTDMEGSCPRVGEG
jgi:hypothetical protein